MRCAALPGGRPERGTAGLANDVRSSHFLVNDRLRRVRSLELGPALFSGQSRPETKSLGDTPSLA